MEHGALQGAIAIGHRALKMGATKEEIIKALRISYQIGGNRALLHPHKSCKPCSNRNKGYFFN